MQGIHNYTPETNLVSRVYTVATVLYLQFVLHVTLFPVLNVLYYQYIQERISQLLHFKSYKIIHDIC